MNKSIQVNKCGALIARRANVKLVTRINEIRNPFSKAVVLHPLGALATLHVEPRRTGLGEKRLI